MNRPTVISMFSGIGGIDLAFEQAGFNVIWANDCDSKACITYRNNFSQKTIIESDIQNIDEHEVPNADVIVAGFPCQPFSIMGRQKGFKDKRGSLFFEIIRIAEHVKPQVIFLENVRNLMNHDKGQTFITIFYRLSELGYDVKYAIQSPHTHANIPQERQRIFIIAFYDYNTLTKFAFPEETPLTNDLNCIFNRSIKKHESYYYLPNNKYYDLLNAKINDKTGIYRIDDSGVATKRYKISPTLKANMGTYHDRVPIIRDDFGLRKITPYECLALQGFPSSFVFKDVSIEDAYKQCGNTVCVPVVKRIADNIYRSLRSINNENV